MEAVHQFGYYPVTVMESPVVFQAEKISTDDPAAQVSQALEIVPHWLRNLVPLLKVQVVFRYRLDIDQDGVDKVLSQVAIENAHVVGIGKVVGLALLGHDVANVDNFRLAFTYRVPDRFNH